MALPEEFLQKLKDANPIENVVSTYVRLRRTGRNLVGLCPFHGEKSPSFFLYPENDSFYCYPKKQNVITKLAFATEEIYKLNLKLANNAKV